MFTSDWSLVLFTILMQTAVGMLVISEVARFVAPQGAPRKLAWQAPVACGISALGLLASLSHLGTPTHSFFTIFNVGSSWLSREILAVGGFFGATLLLVLLRRKNPANHFWALSGAAMFIGLVAVFIMSKVYMLETIPVWDTSGTALSFYGTMLLAGAVAGGLLLRFQTVSGPQAAKPAVPDGKILAVFCGAAVLGLAFKFIGIPLDMAAMGIADSYGTSGLDIVAVSGLGLLVLRFALIFAGAALFAWGLFKTIHSMEIGSAATIGSFALVMAGEILGRLMFYEAYLRTGL
ncbi:MAG: dimethyl sulfoxide reductase anchor subunit [Desulfovibrio sp.]|jgi:anaerobic dimethyl sulfoxide reductase subunit C (anchor subunit)|nr:dimethyl sulfoxide reductase anchor subunit [Desulfovibrio sp.]